MEGVVLVEMSSGALHYTRSFSDTFDMRHPKSERLNLSALIFALQNFAGSSTRATQNSITADADNDLKESDVAGIVLFATPFENMVLSTTPSRKLLVVLFTIPDFDLEIAKWLVNRLALNYDRGDNAEMQSSNHSNLVPRRFRQAFTQAVEAVVERELIRLSENIFGLKDKQTNSIADTPGGQETFICFEYASQINSIGSDDTKNDSKSSQADRTEECRHAVRADSTVVSVPNAKVRNFRVFRFRNMGIVTPTTATPTDDELLHKKKAKTKSRWRSRNTVINYLEPYKFRREFQIHVSEGRIALIDPYRTDNTCAFKNEYFPFGKIPSLLSLASSMEFSEPQQRSKNLDQCVWTNPCVASSAGKKQMGGTILVAWSRGPCCLYYTIKPRSMQSEDGSRIRLIVTALFNVLEPVLNAQAKILA